MTLREKTLTLGVSNEVFTYWDVMNNYDEEDDDIILASQALRRERTKPNVKLEIKKDKNSSSQKVLEICPLNTIHQSFNPYTYTKSQKNKHTGLEAFQNIGNDLHLNNLLAKTDQKGTSTFGVFQSELPAKKRNESTLSANSKNDRFQILNEPLIPKLDLKSSIKNSVRPPNFDSLMPLPISSETSLFDSNVLNKDIIQGYTVSQALFADDKTLSKEKVISCQDEVLTSGIILSTQPNNAVDLKNKLHFIKTPEVIANEIFRTSSYEKAVKKNDELSLDVEVKTMVFSLSVSCLIVSSRKTNDIIKKSILIVDDSSKSSNLCEDSNKPLILRSLNDLINSREKNNSSTDLDDCQSLREKTFTRNNTEGESSRQAYSVKKIQWTNEHLLRAKLDELIEISLRSTDSTSNGSTETVKNLKIERSSAHSSSETIYSVREKKNNHKTTEIEEDADMFPSGSTAADSNDLNVLSNSSNLRSDADIFFRNFQTEKKTVIEDLHVTQELFTVEKKEINIDRTSLNEQSFFSSKKTDDFESIPAKQNIQNNFQYRLEEGELVLAKWTTDHKYYSGRLLKRQEENFWLVQYSDGKLMMVVEDYIIPWKWLQKGDMVSVFNGKNYLSGKLIEIKRDTTCNVELDVNSRQITVEALNVSLEEEVAAILREKFIPLKLSSREQKRSYDPCTSGLKKTSNLSEFISKNIRDIHHITRKTKDGKGKNTTYSVTLNGKRRNVLKCPRSRTSHRKHSKNKSRKVRRSFFVGLPANDLDIPR